MKKSILVLTDNAAHAAEAAAILAKQTGCNIGFPPRISSCCRESNLLTIPKMKTERKSKGRSGTALGASRVAAKEIKVTIASIDQNHESI